jgi:ribonuclease HI
METFHGQTSMVLLRRTPPPQAGLGRAGGILHLSVSHRIYFEAGVGQGSNNFSELMALNLILFLALEHGVTHLQIYGDSFLAIKWRQEWALRNFTLQPLFQDIWSLQSVFTHISFAHIYRDSNGTADSLSKEGIDLD